MDWVAISRAGKFCRGKVRMTATEYANCTDVAINPGGRDVVKTVCTSFPNEAQHVIPKKT